jgi:hypothetical protein
VRPGLTAAVALAAAATGAAAQPAPAAAGAVPARCTYDACALRRESVFFSERLVAGAGGRVVARPRLFGAFPLDSVVRGVPDAEPHARVYRRERVRSGVLTAVGGALAIAAVVSAVDRSDGDCTVVGVGSVVGCSNRNRGRTTALVAGSAAFNLAGAWRFQIADRALNRAVWHYNRALPR